MHTDIILPNTAFEASYREYIAELGDEERYPFSLDFDNHNFPAMLQKIEDFRLGQNLPKGFVPSTTYWMVHKSELVGVSNLRHCLNDAIRNAGGHIGLGIRPSYRKQGLSKQLLQQTILRAKQMAINEIHIHCYKHNLASASMILSCGGVLASELVQTEQTIQRYIVR